MPFGKAYYFLISRKAGKDLSKVLFMRRRELNGHGHGVNDPAEHCLDGAPVAISLAEFLQGDWLMTKLIIIKIVGPED